MSIRTHNTQLFALPAPPPEALAVGRLQYRLARVFKHDFFAATCLYELADAPEAPGEAMPRIVVKFGRTQGFCGLPCQWLGRSYCRHEEAIYAALAGVRGVPRWAGRLGEAVWAIEYIEAQPMDHLPSVAPAVFDRLRGIFDAIHARGVGYCDANKRSNILVTAAGEPFLVDYQISIRRHDDWPWPLRAMAAAAVRYAAQKDLYHLYKHKRRLCPQALTPEQEALSRGRTGWHLVHRRLTKPWRSLRRWFPLPRNRDIRWPTTSPR